MTSVLKEPLFHFLLIGAGLFIAYGAMNKSESGDAGNQLAGIYQKTWQRPPTRGELQGLIDDFVLEEIYYRRALEMGLDRDDTIVRRRMRQKLEFLTDGLASMVEPTDDDLQGYLEEHPDKFRTSTTYSFEQTYFNPDRYGEDPEAVIAAKLVELRGGDADVEAVVAGELRDGMVYQSQAENVRDIFYGNRFVAQGMKNVFQALFCADR